MDDLTRKKIARLEKRVDEMEQDFRKMCLILAIHEIRLGKEEEKHDSE